MMTSVIYQALFLQFAKCSFLIGLLMENFVYQSSDDRFLHVQRRRIEHDKWCEGFRIQQDPGNQYVLDWISSFAGTFRAAWNKSLCKKCSRYSECGLSVLNDCSRFELFTDQS